MKELGKVGRRKRRKEKKCEAKRDMSEKEGHEQIDMKEEE